MGEENITFAELSDVISKEFKMLEEKIDSIEIECYHKELQEFAQELYTCDSLDNHDRSCGSAPIIGCTKQPSSTFAYPTGVGPDTQGSSH